MSLQEQLWYWGKISKADVSNIMSEKPDGSFLVRDASTPGEYTLTIRYKGQTKLVRIHIANGRCGFSTAALNFDSVVELIEAYRRISLKEFNDNLDTALEYPICKILVRSNSQIHGQMRSSRASTNSSSRSFDLDSGHQSQPSTSKTTVSTEQLNNEHHIDKEWETGLLLERLRISQAAVERSKRLQEILERDTLRADALHHSYIKTISDLDKKTNRLEEVIKVQSETMNKDSEGHAKTAIGNNKKIIVTSVAKMKNEKDEILAKKNKLCAIIDQLREETIMAKNRATEALVIRDEAVLALGHRKISQSQQHNTIINAQDLVEAKESTLVSMLLADLPLHWDPIQYLIHDASKDNAAVLLYKCRTRLAAQGEPSNGIFLIRPSSSHPNKLVLSVLYGDRVSHCLIEQNDEGWGFPNCGLYFVTIGDFVRYYTSTTLEDHNKEMPTSLKIAAL